MPCEAQGEVEGRSGVHVFFRLGVGWGVEVVSGSGVFGPEGLRPEWVGVSPPAGGGVGMSVEADTVGMGLGFLGRSSRSDASATKRVLVDLLYFPAAKILLLIKFFKSILAGTSKVIASDEEIIR